jgi:hypothetical protein
MRFEIDIAMPQPGRPSFNFSILAYISIEQMTNDISCSFIGICERPN